VRRAFQLSSFNKLVTKPIAIVSKLDDADFLAQVEAVDRFTENMIAYPGRTFGQLYHRMVKGNQLAQGSMRMDDREISLADIHVPLLAFGGAGDGIAPVESVRPIVDLVSGVDDLRFEIVPGGHLGMLTGRAARRTTWRIIDEWLAEHSTQTADTPPKKSGANPRRTGSRAKPSSRNRPRVAGGKASKQSARAESEATPRPRRKGTGTAGRRTGSRKDGGSQPAVKKAAKRADDRSASSERPAAEPAAPRATAPDPESIGANPNRRYGSASSRSLAGGS
jgi:polyhydroxyalkanoate synthase